MIQKILKHLLPKDKFQKIEYESKNWIMKCPKCGFSKSYWEAGGVRAFAISNRKSILGRCPKCNRFKLFTVIRKGGM